MAISFNSGGLVNGVVYYPRAFFSRCPDYTVADRMLVEYYEETWETAGCAMHWAPENGMEDDDEALTL